MKRIVRGLPFVAMAALLAAAVWLPVPALLARAQAGEVNLYSARHYDTDQSLYDGFTAQTGITVNVVQAGEDQLIERLKSEGANSPADILLTVDAGRLYRAQEAGLFQPIRSDVLDVRIPANLREPEGHWFGFATRRGRYPHTDAGVEVRRVFHQLRSVAIENFNGQFKGIFDAHGPVPTRGLVRTRRFALGAVFLYAVFLYQVTLLYRFKHQQDLRVGLKAFLKAA